MFQNDVRRYVVVLQIDRTLLSMFCTWSITLRNYCLWTPPPPRNRNFKWSSMEGVWIFSGTTQVLSSCIFINFREINNQLFNIWLLSNTCSIDYCFHLLNMLRLIQLTLLSGGGWLFELTDTIKILYITPTVSPYKLCDHLLFSKFRNVSIVDTVLFWTCN